MTFNEKLDRHYSNLDAAHDALLESREQEMLETEALVDEILTDTELFERLAIKFCWWDTGNGYPRLTFLDWAVNRLRRERTPEYSEGWVRDAKI